MGVKALQLVILAALAILAMAVLVRKAPEMVGKMAVLVTVVMVGTVTMLALGILLVLEKVEKVMVQETVQETETDLETMTVREKAQGMEMVTEMGTEGVDQ